MLLPHKGKIKIGSLDNDSQQESLRRFRSQDLERMECKSCPRFGVRALEFAECEELGFVSEQPLMKEDRVVGDTKRTLEA